MNSHDTAFMHGGRRPERRNRKIGTSAAGYGQSNKMVVPEPSRGGHFFYERLGPHREIECTLHGQTVFMLVEAPRDGWTFGCSPYDVVFLLSQLPKEDVCGLDIVVFRQPTRKQHILRPVWGRCVFDADFGRARGAAIILEAIDLSKTISWSRKVSLEDRAELERLVADGHCVERQRKGTWIRPTETAVRNTILYRTLLHEVGHWRDWKSRVLQACDPSDPDARARLENTYFARPLSEREEAAHRYADAQHARLRAAGKIPFDPI